MRHKSKIRKNKFECGHTGLGKYCHLCRDIEKGLLVKTTDGKYLPPDNINNMININKEK